MPIIKIYPSKRPVRGILQYITRGDTVPEELIRTNGCDILDAEQEFPISRVTTINPQVSETAPTTI